MSVLNSRSVLLGGLLAAALFAPAWSADDAAKPDAAVTEQPVAMAASPQAGPVIARESLATESSARATVVVGENQPTRATAYPTLGKRYAGKRMIGGGSTVAYNRPVYRHSLMLGIGY
jgi:hypothetical protein